MTTIELRDCDGIKVAPDFFAFKERLRLFNVRNDDVWLTAYPKTGSTWCTEMLWLIGNNLDFETANRLPVFVRFPFIEFNTFIKEMDEFAKKHNLPCKPHPDFPDFLDVVDKIEGTRYIKTHLPWDFLPRQITDKIKTPKVIHVMRDPKQVVASYYHHAAKIFPTFHGTLDEFVDFCIKGNVLYGDYFRTLLSYWNERHRPNLLILTYEEMHADLPAAIRKVCNFLEKSYSEEQIKELAYHLSFDQMKKNPMVNAQKIIDNEDIQFIRKGKTDSYKEELTPDMIAKLDRWIARNTKETGLPYEKC